MYCVMRAAMPFSFGEEQDGEVDRLQRQHLLLGDKLSSYPIVELPASARAKSCLPR